jgi:hypothetical protein
MRRYLLLLLLAGFSTVVAQNRAYFPFPSKMIVFTYKTIGYSDRTEYGADRFELQGDTLINGLHYAKCITSTTINKPKEFVNALVGGVRNDLATKKVYLYLFSEKKEVLLYDFDLHVGDTLFKKEGYGFYRSLFHPEVTGIGAASSIDTVWVSRIDSVITPHDGLYHKRFHFKAKYAFPKGGANPAYYTITSDSNNETHTPTGDYFTIKINPLIEGVGPEFDPVTSRSMFEYAFDYSLFCRSIDEKPLNVYTENSNPFYSKLYCSSITIGMDQEDKNTSISVYPNPSYGKFILKVADAELKRFEVINVLGMKILSAQIQNNETMIDLTNQPKGIYFIRTYDKNNQYAISKVILD